MDYDTATYVFAGLFALSEVLSFIPKVKSNGAFQMLYNVLRFLIAPRGPSPPSTGTK